MGREGSARPAVTIAFQTSRQTIRHWTPEDEADIRALYSDPAVIPFIDDGLPIPPKDAARWMQITQQNYQQRGYGMFAITHRDGGPSIGFGGLVHPGGAPDAEVKYALTPAAWGQGLATEFVRGLVTFAWHKGLPRLTSTVDRRNTASQNVLAKAGFHLVRWEPHPDGTATGHYLLVSPLAAQAKP